LISVQKQDNWLVLAKKDVSYKADKDLITPVGNEKNVSKDKQLKKVEIEYEAYGNILLTKKVKVEILGLEHKK